MAVRGRAAAAAAAAAAVAMAAVDRRLPSLDDFAGQSWSAWVERAGPPAAETGSELEENSRNGSKKLDAMTLIKEDMSIFGHCPAHDEFYLVVCNHCGQVVKPEAFQKHCERRHGPLNKLYGRVQSSSNVQKCHAVNGRSFASGGHGSTKSWREKSQNSFSQTQHMPERTDKIPKDNLCWPPAGEINRSRYGEKGKSFKNNPSSPPQTLASWGDRSSLFVPVVNLEKIPSLSKSDGDGVNVPPKSSDSTVHRQSSAGSKEILGKSTFVVSSKEPLVSAKGGGNSSLSVDGLSRKLENTSTLAEKELGAVKSLKKMPRKECDLNRQCGVVNPETRKVCTRLLTCKIHSVHQRREVQGRDKDFDVLVAELKANAKKGEPSKEKSSAKKEAAPERLAQDSSSLPQTSLALRNTSPCHLKQPYSHCALSRTKASSESDPDDPLPTTSGEGDHRLYPFPVPKSSGWASSEESEDDAVEDSHKLDCHYATRAPRPQAFCTFGSRLVSPGCYVFSRRLDRFCSALSSMLERHLSSHMWKRIPPAADHPTLSPPSAVLLGFSASTASPNGSSPLPCSLPHSLPGQTSGSGAASATLASRDSRSHHSMNYAVGSPHAAAACSQPDCLGGSQPITSPLPAHTPSPSFSKLPLTKASRSSRAKETTAGNVDLEASLARKRKQPPSALTSPPYKQTCFLELGRSKAAGCQISRTTTTTTTTTTKTKPSVVPSSALSLNGAVSAGARIKLASHLDCRASSHGPVKPSQLENRGSSLNGPKALPASCISDEEAKRRKNTATYCRPVKAKHSPSPLPSSSDLGSSVRRKKPVVSLGFEKQNTVKSKAH